MNIFIDCEFNSYKGELISMALVSETSHAFYEVLPLPENIDPWVRENVIPVLEKKPLASREEFQMYLEEWLNRFNTIHLIADWPEDIQYFCEALITGPGERMSTPPITLEIRRDLDAKSTVPHNALHDALAIMDRHEEIITEKMCST